MYSYLQAAGSPYKPKGNVAPFAKQPAQERCHQSGLVIYRKVHQWEHSLFRGVSGAELVCHWNCQTCFSPLTSPSLTTLSACVLSIQTHPFRNCHYNLLSTRILCWLVRPSPEVGCNKGCGSCWEQPGCCSLSQVFGSTVSMSWHGILKDFVVECRRHIRLVSIIPISRLNI